METFNEDFKKPTSDYLRVVTASPEVAIADPEKNAQNIMACYESASRDNAQLVAMPELCVTGYSSADMFFNTHVQNETNKALHSLAQITSDGPALVVGAPIENDGILYNCAVMLAGGRVAGIVPKSYLPNYNEFYEKRWFTSGRGAQNRTVSFMNEDVPFGTDLLFNVDGTKVGLEVCEDAWAPITPSARAALAGAEVIVNVSTSNELIGKAEYRKEMISGLAGKLLCAYVYTSSGSGESTADVVYGGHQIISENGRVLSEVKQLQDGMAVADIDREEIVAERLVNKTYADQAEEQRATTQYRVIDASNSKSIDTSGSLLRTIDAHPFVPSNPETLDIRCEQLFDMMASSLARRIQETQTSTRATKRAIEAFVDYGAALALIARTPLYRFQYRQGDTDTAHVGIMADESPEFTRYQQTAFDPVNAFGYTAAAIKALLRRVDILEAALAARG
jgi:NAD+ synthase (glutamine-hydrolysing)